MHAVRQQMQRQVVAHMQVKRCQGLIHPALQQGGGMQQHARGGHGIALRNGLVGQDAFQSGVEAHDFYQYSFV